MRNYTIAFLLKFLYNTAFCQDHYLRNCRNNCQKLRMTTVRMTIAAELDIYFYGDRNQDSSLYYFQVAENIGKQLQFTNTDIYKRLLFYFNQPDTVRLLTTSQRCNCILPQIQIQRCFTDKRHLIFHDK